MTPRVAEAEQQSVEDLELELLLTALAEHYGYDFRCYGRASLKRRMRYIRAAANVDSFSQLQHRVLRDPAYVDELIAGISVHVTEMFRDPSFYAALRQEVVPQLRTHPFVRIWMAGCATGEEVHSLAILLEEEGLYDRCRIYATDISNELLVRAARGIYPVGSLRAFTQNYQRAGGGCAFSDYYVADHAHAMFRERLRRNVTFARHNLVCDGPFNEFNLILCRNVMIYFGPVLRERVHELLHSSLARFGLLALGAKESLMFSPIAEKFTAWLPEQRIYRRNP